MEQLLRDAGYARYRGWMKFVRGTDAPGATHTDLTVRKIGPRLAADFANFRKQTDKRQAEMAGQAGAGLLERLLPVLDACDSAAQQGADDVVPIRDMFRDFLVREGLEIVDTVGAEFDPNVHEAVLREEGDGETQVVAEVLRSGYVLHGHVLRAAMVKVQG